MFFIQNLVLLAVLISVQSEHLWSYDLVSIDVNNETPDIVYADAKITRLSRGVFTASGIIYIKQNLTDELRLEGITYYSWSGGQDYTKSVYSMPECNLSHAINNYYKHFIMKDLVPCCENALYFEDQFIPPLMENKIIMNNCTLFNYNMPLKVKPGYYKLILQYFNQAKGSIEFVIKVYDRY